MRACFGMICRTWSEMASITSCSGTREVCLCVPLSVSQWVLCVCVSECGSVSVHACHYILFGMSNFRDKQLTKLLGISSAVPPSHLHCTTPLLFQFGSLYISISALRSLPFCQLRAMGTPSLSLMLCLPLTLPLFLIASLMLCLSPTLPPKLWLLW